MKRKLLILMLALVTVGSGFACAPQPTPAPAPKEVGFIELRVVSNLVGTLQYTIGVAFAQVVRQYSDRIRLIIVPGKGTLQHNRLLVEGKTDITTVDGATLVESAKGIAGGWEKYGPQPHLRLMMPASPSEVHVWVPKESPIQTIYDIKGKKVALGSKAWATMPSVVAVLKGAGIDPEKDISATWYSTVDEVNNALRDGHADVAINQASVGVAAHIELSTVKAVRLIPFPDDLLARAAELRPGGLVVVEIPGGSYRGVDKAVKTFAVTSLWASSTKVPEDVMYELVKIIFEHRDVVEEIVPAFKKYTPELIAQDYGMPYHEGALKYYREVGWIK